MYGIFGMSLIVPVFVGFSWFWFHIRKWKRSYVCGSSSIDEVSVIIQFLKEQKKDNKLYALLYNNDTPVYCFCSSECFGWLSCHSTQYQVLYNIYCCWKEDLKSDKTCIFEWNYNANVLFDADWKNIGNINTIEPYGKEQEDILNDIIKKQQNSFKNVGYYGGIFHIRGNKGTGKSCMGKLIGSKLLKEHKEVNIAYYNPTVPSSSWSALLRNINHSSDVPLIVIVDEADELFMKCFPSQLSYYKFSSIEIYDKKSLNKWLDNAMETKNVITILTMNKKLEHITNIDDSCYRKGRVIETYDLNEQCAEHFINERFGCKECPDFVKIVYK